ncbi:DegT/DnrJ/EryC1/StrS family aminotransferase [Legionella brunensis]|uniref:Cell wall biosynthesis regulatory pyridoxal phosphate-dependent protein n=1 Tax=Legionella brunensis TaxID=29422 RepID=A0A0W0SRA5_9GAMM|nr:DegT/DnrJ/EryC1/StrS family aminotransferase [Legionella brunensis]KTC85509.1 cell wall biosynthesis regulatory pyridoxal phosphate-dependent protein [Legionella brunensis]
MNEEKPVRTQPLPWEFPGANWIDEEEQRLVNEVIKSHSPFRYYGPDLQHMVDRLESLFCQQLGVNYALGVSSGTAALHIVMAAFGVGPGDEVLVPGYMWVSCLSAIVRLGAIPVLVDIDNTFCMDPKDLERKISSRSKAILCVHMSGASGYIDKIAAIAAKNNLYLLEDCAQAAGATYKGQPLGSFGDAAIFSFQLNKNMTSGEGGMIVCKEKSLYQRCFAIHDLGYPRNDAGRLDTQHEEFQLWGIGARMSELTAAFALAQLGKLNAITESMRKSKWQIRDALTGIQGFGFREIPSREGDSGPFLITIYPNQTLCQDFTQQLQRLGIKGQPGSLACITMREWGLHWYFNNFSLVKKRSLSADGFPWTHPKNEFSREISYQRGALPTCDDLHDRAALLTIASNLSSEDCEQIITAFKIAASRVLQ